MQKCTSIEVFKVKMDSLKKENKRVIINVIENLLADAVKMAVAEKKEETIEYTVEEALKTFFEVVETAATRLPGTRFVVVETINRPSLKWYVKRQDDIMQDYERRIKDMKLLNVNKIPAIVKASQVFEQDQVYLTIEAGKSFGQTILYFAGEIFEAEMVDLEESDNKMDVTAIQVDEGEKDEGGPIAGPPSRKQLKKN